MSHYTFPKAPPRSRSQGVTLMTVTSPIPTHPSTALIDRAIEGIERMNYNFADKIIAYDKPKKSNANYEKYKKKMKEKYLSSDGWTHLEMDVHGHFIGTFYKALLQCKTKYVFMNQHDIELKVTFPINKMKQLPSKDWNIIATHHMKNGLKPTHWYPIIQKSKYPELLKTWGWSERIFLSKTDYLLKTIYNLYHNGISKDFIDTNFHKQFNRLYKRRKGGYPIKISIILNINKPMKNFGMNGNPSI